MSVLQLPVDVPFSPEQQVWLAGFLAGVATQQQVAEKDSAAPSLTAQVLVGTQTGNCEALALQLSDNARAAGLGAPVASLDDLDVAALTSMSHLVIITSTYGEGEMPDNAELFWEALAAPTAPRLENLKFAVLALGDSGYDDFCQAGKLLDTRLEQLGASRMLPRVDCDVDFDEPAEAWIAELLTRLAAEAPAGSGAPVAAAAAAPKRAASPWNRKTPYPSRLVENRRLSGPDSAKEIRHLEFDLGDSGITYAAGDALNVVPLNDPDLVQAILEQLSLDGDTASGDTTLRQRLTAGLEIRTPSKDLIALLVDRDPEGELAGLEERDEKEFLDRWLWGKDVLDLLQLTGVTLTADELVKVLRPLQPRAYSISSSSLHSPDRIHLTVAAVRHGVDRIQGGVCSTFMADRLTADDPVGIFLQPNAAFRVPGPDVPMIMIGPGTGVAPFRAFLQERVASGARGRNWLFFGDQHAADDFIYADELEKFGSDGVLHRLDLAFSRDQAEKIYVQTRMKQAGKELYDWLEDGAHVYVCGDASRMAKDVDRALLEIIAEHRGGGDSDAADYIATLKRAKRYVRDVY